MSLKCRFQAYRTKDGDEPFAVWYSTLPREALSDFGTIRLHLSSKGGKWEIADGAKTLTKRHVGLVQLMFSFNEWTARASKGKARRFRAIGVRREAEEDFVIFTGCEEVGGQYHPVDAFERALKLLGELQQGLGAPYDYEF